MGKSLCRTLYIHLSIFLQRTGKNYFLKLNTMHGTTLLVNYSLKCPQHSWGRLRLRNRGNRALAVTRNNPRVQCEQFLRLNFAGGSKHRALHSAPARRRRSHKWRRVILSKLTTAANGASFHITGVAPAKTGVYCSCSARGAPNLAGDEVRTSLVRLVRD